MARLERLVNLLAALIDTDRPLSRNDLQQRVPGYATDDSAFRRAFERDKETLRAMGIPILTLPLDPEYPDHGDGYRIPKDQYYLPDPGLTREEMSALALAASAVKLKSQSASAALWKLGADVDAMNTTNDVELPESDELATIFAARRSRQRITFQYKNVFRNLDPYRLTFRNGHWYVNGYDHGHQDVRTYRLDRMKDVSASGTPNAFDDPPRTDQPWLPAWRMGDESPVVAELLIDADYADLAIDQAGANAVAERRPNGTVVLALEVTNRDAFRSFALGFLEHAEVLGPDELRDDMITYLRKLSA